MFIPWQSHYLLQQGFFVVVVPVLFCFGLVLHLGPKERPQCYRLSSPVWRLFFITSFIFSLHSSLSTTHYSQITGS